MAEKKWQPTAQELQRAEQLAALGTPELILAAEIFAVTDPGEWRRRKANSPALVEALKRGVAASKDPYRASDKGWYPKPETFPVVTELVAKGYGFKEVAYSIGTTERVLKKRAAEIPELADAIEAGEAQRNIELIDLAQNMARGKKKGNTPMVIYLTKSLCGLTDQPVQKVQHSGTVEIVGKLAPVKRVSAEKVPVLVDSEMRKVAKRKQKSEKSEENGQKIEGTEETGETSGDTTLKIVDAEVVER